MRLPLKISTELFHYGLLGSLLQIFIQRVIHLAWLVLVAQLAMMLMPCGTAMAAWLFAIGAWRVVALMCYSAHVT